VGLVFCGIKPRAQAFDHSERVKGNLMNAPDTSSLETWPDLPLDAWKETYATLHMWMQIAGKIRLTQCSWVNHSWHVTLYVTARGLTTSLIPHGTRNFQIDFGLRRPSPDRAG